jgi:membrane-bound lytic murein transglycosylase B
MGIRYRNVFPVLLSLCMGLIFLVLGTASARAAAEPRFETLKGRLLADGFDAGHIETLYKNPNVSFDTRRVSLFFKHRESTLNYDQFASKKSIRNAKKYMKTHKSALDTAEKTYGVDREVITAILLVETRLGTNTGKTSVLNILSTMSSLSDPEVRELFWKDISRKTEFTRNRYDKWVDRKSKWAYTELKSFLKYTSREKIDPADIKGSYAGALGISQFIPSSILAYAKDGNSDGTVNLFDHADAISSVGNYLKRKGWRPGIGREKAEKVIWTYNHSDYYVAIILKVSDILKESA